MKIEFTDSFFESLERLRMQQTWWYKTYEFFRYNMPYFFKNIWSFRRELYRFRTWDYQFNQDLFSRSLELTADGMEKYGREVDESRLKKVAMMRRAAELLRNREDAIYEIVDNEIGPLKTDYIFDEELTAEEQEHSSRHFARVKELFDAEREELWTILKGTGIIDDGTDIRGWWRS